MGRHVPSQTSQQGMYNKAGRRIRLVLGPVTTARGVRRASQLPRPTQFEPGHWESRTSCQECVVVCWQAAIGGLSRGQRDPTRNIPALATCHDDEINRCLVLCVRGVEASRWASSSAARSRLDQRPSVRSSLISICFFRDLRFAIPQQTSLAGCSCMGSPPTSIHCAITNSIFA